MQNDITKRTGLFGAIAGVSLATNKLGRFTNNNIKVKYEDNIYDLDSYQDDNGVRRLEYHSRYDQEHIAKCDDCRRDHEDSIQDCSYDDDYESEEE